MTTATEPDTTPDVATRPDLEPSEVCVGEAAVPPEPSDEAAGEGEQAPVPPEGAGAGSPCEPCAEYLDALTRLKAEFANYRRRAAEQQAQAAERGAADLALRLLAVLDAAEAGAAHDDELVGPLHSALLDALTESGLEVISPAGEPFDPNYHEAVMHTAPEERSTVESAGTPIVTDVLRTGYAWGGRVLRPAVVGVQG